MSDRVVFKMSDRVVFKTTDPDALAAWDEWEAAYDAWHDRMAELREATGADQWHYNTWDGSILGPDKYSTDAEAAVGWAEYKKYDYLKPARGAAGRVAREAVERVGRMPQAADLANTLGLPDILFGAGRFIRPGFHQWAGTLYLSWPSDPSATGDGFDSGDRWESCPLSEFYAAKEASAAAGATGGAA